ncbi:tetratricopeptide repeat protein [Elusimicrobiota bacterium]
MEKLKLMTLLIAASLVFCGCENGNIFSWTHSAGGDDAPEALLADANKSIADGDYDEAIEYFESILKDDPDNSEAMYGIAAAELKAAGLDISELLPKFLDEDASGNGAIAYGSPDKGGRSSSSLDDLLPLLNYDRLEEATEVAVEMLEEIVSGRADGTISPDDIDVNINLAVAKVVHSAAYLMNKYPKFGVDEDFNVVGYEDISNSDKNLVLDEIESAIVDNLSVIISHTDIDIEDIKDGIKKFRNELNQ